MKRNLIFAAILILTVSVLNAQAPTRQFPDIATTSANQTIALLGYKGTVESYLTQDGTDIQNLQHAVAAPATGLLDRMAALEARVALLENPVPPPPAPTTTESFTSLSTGPLTGIVSTIDWGVGMWNATAQGVQPAVLGVARSFVLPSNVTMTNITVECLTAQCVVNFAAASGDTTSTGILLAGNVVVLNTSWTKASGKIGVTTPNSPATDVRILALSYK